MKQPRDAAAEQNPAPLFSSIEVSRVKSLGLPAGRVQGAGDERSRELTAAKRLLRQSRRAVQRQARERDRARLQRFAVAAGELRDDDDGRWMSFDERIQEQTIEQTADVLSRGSGPQDEANQANPVPPEEEPSATIRKRPRLTLVTL